MKLYKNKKSNIHRHGLSSTMKIKKGQKIKRGDVLGKSGNSGRAAGFHLHYEVHKNKKVEDPKKYFFTGYIK